MKILCSGDWHIGNLFHGNDRLPEHRHFLSWLLTQIELQQPDALLIAGDVFDNGNPSAAAQSLYYQFLVDASAACPQMMTIIIAGNHDSAARLEAPRALLCCHNIEVRGRVCRNWTDEGWQTNFDDLLIPVNDGQGCEVVVAAVPYLRNDVLDTSDYSAGVRLFMTRLCRRAREIYPGRKVLMLAHLYAGGAEIATRDAAERIVVGGLEQVSMTGWEEYPDILISGHIHKRQSIKSIADGHYCGSVLPMSFAEKDYTHGVDLLTIDDDKIGYQQIVYTPQHRLVVLPADDEELTYKKLEKLLDSELPDRIDGRLDSDFVYLALKVSLDKIKGEQLKAIEDLVGRKNAVLCKLQRLMPQLDLGTIATGDTISSVDDILGRDPLDAIAEAFAIHHQRELSDNQRHILTKIIDEIQL